MITHFLMHMRLFPIIDDVDEQYCWDKQNAVGTNRNYGDERLCHTNERTKSVGYIE